MHGITASLVVVAVAGLAHAAPQNQAQCDSSERTADFAVESNGQLPGVTKGAIHAEGLSFQGFVPRYSTLFGPTPAGTTPPRGLEGETGAMHNLGHTSVEMGSPRLTIGEPVNITAEDGGSFTLESFNLVCGQNVQVPPSDSSWFPTPCKVAIRGQTLNPSASGSFTFECRYGLNEQDIAQVPPNLAPTLCTPPATAVTSISFDIVQGFEKLDVKQQQEADAAHMSQTSYHLGIDKVKTRKACGLL